MKIARTLKRFQDLARALQISRSMKAREHWHRQQLEQFQQQQLTKLVRHAIARSDFYRDLYRHIPLDREIRLEELPIIDKKMVMENFDRLVTDPRLKMNDLHHYLAALTANKSTDNYYLGEYCVLSTSGSSGNKGLFVYNRQEWSQFLAGAMRSTQFMGLSPRWPHRVKISAIAADNILHASSRVLASGNVGLYQIQHLSATSSIGELVKSLNAFQPESLNSYPSILSLLAVEQLAGNLHIHPRLISTGAEVCTPEMRAKIVRAWGVEPFNAYGLTETGNVATECDRHQGLHIFEDRLILEAVDRYHQPVPDGLPGDKVLLTNLFNYTQPLIRYEVSDLLTISQEMCPCGRPFRLVANLNGRNDDTIYLPGIQAQRVAVPPFHFFNLTHNIPEIEQFQVVHHQQDLHLRLVAQESTDREAVADRVREKLRQTLTGVGAKIPDLHIEFVSEIDRDSKQMGKVKVVSSTVQ